MFDVAPQKEASITSYLHSQIFFTLQPVVDTRRLEGKTAIVTGSSCSIGLYYSRQLLDLGITMLILAVRSRARGQAAIEDLFRGRDLSAVSRSIEVWDLKIPKQFAMLGVESTSP
ncbi:uncharacterized protein PG998_012184 [Apiospora kogelbergensis]|uniref:uncharacterized protein n=1 Tax=Apiospora kogelbergensis TaxID=1337665 RepID=UPI00312D65AF